MEIHTKRFILRPLCMDDLHTVFEWQSDAETQKYINPPHTDITQAVEYLEWVTEEWQSSHQKYFSFGIMLGDKLIGETGFSYGCGKCGRCLPGEAALGYIIHPNFQNCGYEIEALKAIIEYCFKELGAKIIKNAVDIENIAQIRVIENLGFQLKTENEECEYNDGKPFKRNIYHLNNYYSKQQ